MTTDRFRNQDPCPGRRAGRLEQCRRQGVGGTIDAALKSSGRVELTTLEWVWWFNHHRLLSSIGHVPPVFRGKDVAFQRGHTKGHTSFT